MIIECKNLTKKYLTDGETVIAVDNASLSIARGDFAIILGHSGSGKTTLLNIIGGLDSPTTGEVSISGEVLNRYTRKQLSEMRLKKIGFIFQAYNLIPVLTSIENVEYVLLLQGVSEKERTQRSIGILEEVGLENEMHRRPYELSGGQQQRVAVARAIVSEPDIVLADEPTANLDQDTGASLLELMKNLNQEKNITFLFSTHDTMVMEKSKRLLSLKEGRIDSDDYR